MSVNPSFDYNGALVLLEYVNGSITQMNPIRYKASHEKVRNLTPEFRARLIQLLCPPEGYDQALFAGKHIPYSLLSERVSTRRRNADAKAFMRRKRLLVKTA